MRFPYTPLMAWGSGTRCRRAWVAGLVVTTSVSLGLHHAGASEIALLTRATGTALVQIHGSVLSGTLEGRIRQTGSIDTPDGRIDFEGAGGVTGTGQRELLSKAAEVWLAYHVAATASTGQAVELWGLLYLYRVSEVLLRIGDTLTGIHHVLATIGHTQTHYFGDFRGSLTKGGFVLPEPGALLALAGEGSFVLAGSSTDRPEDASASIPFPSAPWCESFVDHVRSSFPWSPWPTP
jgi:hypothetical protein